MRAILLAGGLGTRLLPLTRSTPKCLVDVCGKPLLGWWFDLLEAHGVASVIINLHHLPEQVQSYVDEYRGPLTIETFHEERLLGSAGTVLACREFLSQSESFLILYGDNLTNVDLGALSAHHRAYQPLLTVGLFRSARPESCGIVELDGSSEGRVTSFIEKPEHPPSNLASAGLFVADRGIFSRFSAEARQPYDFGGDLMPRLIGDMNGVEVEGYLRDVGTHESLAVGREEWAEIVRDLGM